MPELSKPISADSPKPACSTSELLGNRRLRRGDLDDHRPGVVPALLARTGTDEQICYVERVNIRASAGWQPRH